MPKAAAWLSSIVLSLLLGFALLCLSPRDPQAPPAGRGGVPGRASIPPSGWKKIPIVLRQLTSLSSYTHGREPVWRTFARGIARTVGVNLPGILLGWMAGFVLGGVIGVLRGWTLGRFLFGLAVLVVVVPSPVWVLCGRMAWLDTQLFRTGDPVPAILTIAWLTLAPIAINQAVLVGLARERPEVLFARGLGMPFWRTWWRLILPHCRSFWLSELGLLSVAACEGSVLVERAFAIRGLGQAAFEGCTRSDPCLVLLLVGVSSSMANLGVIWTSTRETVR